MLQELIDRLMARNDKIVYHGDDPTDVSILTWVDRKEHKIYQHWRRWILFLIDLDEGTLWPHYGENIQHLKRNYPLVVKSHKDLDESLAYLTDLPQAMVLVGSKTRRVE